MKLYHNILIGWFSRPPRRVARLALSCPLIHRSNLQTRTTPADRLYFPLSRLRSLQTTNSFKQAGTDTDQSRRFSTSRAAQGVPADRLQFRLLLLYLLSAYEQLGEARRGCSYIS